MSACSGESAEPFGAGTLRYDGFQNFRDTYAAFRADEQGIVGGDGQDILDLLLGVIRAGGGQVNLVDHGNDSEIVARG